MSLRSFEESLPMALLRGREATMRFFRPMLAEHDLTEQQWRVLRALAHADGPIDVGRLAAATYLLGPSLSRILTNLDGRGLLTRTVPAHDLRRSMISLSPAGARLVTTIGPHSEARYDRIEAALGPPKVAALMALLRELATIEPVDPEPPAPETPQTTRPRFDDQEHNG